MESQLSKKASPKIRSFTDLYAWQEGHKFVLMIYDVTEEFPTDERFGLISQLRRATVSITSNIAEGFRRRSSADKKQFYTTALSSLTEVQNQLLIARDIHYMNHDLFHNIANQSVRIGKLLTGLIRSTV